MEYYSYLLSGLLILGFINQGLGFTTSTTSRAYEDMQGDDDYIYNDDDNESVSDKSLSIASPKSLVPASFRDSMTKKTTIEGQNLSLECPVINRSDQNVILWYYAKNLLTNQHSVLNPRYKLENNSISYTLIINDVHTKDSGDYYCEVLPEKLRFRVTVNVLPKGSEMPPRQASSSSTSASNSQTVNNSMKIDKNSAANHVHFSYSILICTIFGMFIYLRI